MDYPYDKSAKGQESIPTENGPIQDGVDVEGLDEEQLALCRDNEFWTLLTHRRKEPTISRTELERELSEGRSNAGR